MGWTLGTDPGDSPQYGYHQNPLMNRSSLGAYAWLDLVGDPDVDAFISEWLSTDKWDEFGGNAAAFASEFQKALASTHWWSDKDANWRAGEETRLTDPGTWAENIDVTARDTRIMANNLGVTLSDDVINNIAINANYSLWTETELEQAIIQQADVSPTNLNAGSIQSLADSIVTMGAENFVEISENWAVQQAMLIKSEQKTGEQVIDAVFNLVVDEHPFYDEEKFQTMRQGDLTIADSISSAVTAVSDVLEIDVDYTDDIIKNNLIQEDSSGNKTFINKNQATRAAMQDDRYKQTGGYKDRMKNVSNVFSNVLGVYSL
jgi:hypothetical protein